MCAIFGLALSYAMSFVYGMQNAGLDQAPVACWMDFALLVHQTNIYVKHVTMLC